MANFNDAFQKYIVYGECYYNLETHELKLNHGGYSIEETIKYYPSPKDEAGFMSTLYQYIAYCEEHLYSKGDTVWIKMTDDDYNIKLRLVNDISE